jgi:hypothetical protein
MEHEFQTDRYQLERRESFFANVAFSKYVYQFTIALHTAHHDDEQHERGRAFLQKEALRELSYQGNSAAHE